MFRKILSCLGAILISTTSIASDNLKIIVPGGPGSAPDIVARILADGIETESKKTVSVINRTGAGGLIAVNEALKSPTDGSVIFMTHATSMGSIPVLIPQAQFDPMQDFDHLSIVAAVPRVFAVRSDFPADNYIQFVDQIKKHPNKYNFAGGLNSLEYLFIETFKKRHGIDATFVPYQTQSQILTDFLSGVVQVCACQLSVLDPYIKNGQVKLIAVSWPTRLPDFPSVPTWNEIGIPELGITAWYGLAFPKGVDPRISDSTAQMIEKIINKKSIKERLLLTNTQPMGTSRSDANKIVEYTSTASRKMAQNLR